jgi:site-specific recombinase XerD
MSDLSANIEAFLRACRAKQLSPATVEWYEWLLTEYRNYVEPAGLRWDDPDTLDIFFGEHLAQQGLSAHTVHAYYRALRRFFNWLEKRQRLSGGNPAQMVEPPRLSHPYPRNIEADEVEKLLAAVSGSTWMDRRDRAIILFLWDTGVRAEELCNLEMRDLDLTYRTALIRNGKGRKDRIVPFGFRAKEALESWLEVRSGRARCNRVFVNRSGKPFTRRGLQSMLRRRQKEAGISGPCNPHAFRHGFAVAYLDNGGSIHNLQRLMGHTTLRSTEVYLQSTDRRVREDHAKASPGDHLQIK